VAFQMRVGNGYFRSPILDSQILLTQNKEKAMKKKDLLPVVIIDKRRATTTSLQVAKIFNKKHDNVLRDIEKLDVSEAFNRLNFEAITYHDSRNREQKMYQICKDGFVFLVMGYRGQAAAQFKEAYIQEFNRREKEITSLRVIARNNHQDAEWIEKREAGKPIRRIETDSIQRFVEYAIGQGSQNAKRYYLLFSKLANVLMFDMQTKAVNTRDVCNVNQIGSLKVVDTIITRALEEDMAADVPYKTIYQNVKGKVQQFAELFGKSTIPGDTLQIGM